MLKRKNKFLRVDRPLLHVTCSPRWSFGEAGHMSLKSGFTLIELMIVIAIIGILAGVVTVSGKSAVDKAKRTSALTTASSVLPEMITCQDDSGNIVRPSSVTDGGGTVCDATGHTTQWPNINKTGWSYSVANTASSNISSMTFSLTGGAGSNIACNVAKSGCE